jgi:putative SOS response-associated peptidase YedK
VKPQLLISLQTVQDRMPVILPEQAYDGWLDPQFNDRVKLKALLTLIQPGKRGPFRSAHLATVRGTNH